MTIGFELTNHLKPFAFNDVDTMTKLADAHGALLVFDEVLTAFRFHPGGAQTVYGVTPDLTCAGKAMANGMPLSALMGPGKHGVHGYRPEAYGLDPEPEERRAPRSHVAP